MESNGYGIEKLVSHATGKYHIQYYGKQTYAGKDYHSFVVFTMVRSYYQQVESGVNYSDTILMEYLDELV